MTDNRLDLRYALGAYDTAGTILELALQMDDLDTVRKMIEDQYNMARRNLHDAVMSMSAEKPTQTKEPQQVKTDTGRYEKGTGYRLTEDGSYDLYQPHFSSIGPAEYR